MCHYHSSEASNKPIGHDHFYLNDSGGQYHNGTTDATYLGVGQGQSAAAITLHRRAERFSVADYPAVSVRHPGHQLDAFARRPLWEMGLDFDHGTGHGVGHQLLIHENPHRIAKRSTHGRWWRAIL